MSANDQTFGLFGGLRAGLRKAQEALSPAAARLRQAAPPGATVKVRARRERSAPRADGERRAERGPGRYRKPTDGPTFRRLQELAETDARARAALDDVLAGKFSVTQAMVQIGQRNPRSHFREMVSVWDRATSEQRREFLAHVRGREGEGG